MGLKPVFPGPKMKMGIVGLEGNAGMIEGV